MHWTYKRKVFKPDTNCFGFVYKIINKKTKQAYIGHKQYFLTVKKKQKPSNWETYTSSSVHLNDDIKKHGKKNFTFQIIGEYENKRSLKYYECFYQMKYKVLTALMEGTDEPAYYNNYVGGNFYRPIRVEKP
jgi:hypothetical protein